MDIIAGNTRIPVSSVIAENRYYMEKPYPALRVRFDQSVTDEALEVLKAHDWHLVNTENDLDIELSVQEGYSIIETHEVIFLKPDRAEIENHLLKEEIAAVSSIIPQLLIGKKDDTLVALLKYIPVWTKGKYLVGMVRKYDNQPKICIQEHDSTDNASWNPTVASLWSPYHARSAAYALPWIQPTGAHDMYRADEYMVFTDRRIYRCITDTAYSPTEYPQAWKAVDDALEEGTIT